MQARKIVSSEIDRRLDQIDRNTERLRRFKAAKALYPDRVLIAQCQRVKWLRRQAD